MSNTLGLDTDLDPVEAVMAIEKAFGITVTDEEAQACFTVGDIYDLLERRFAATMAQRGPCMTSMAFYRLRRSVRRMYPGAEFRPDTRLEGCARHNARRFLGRLGADSALRLPGPQGRWVSAIGCLIMLVAVAAGVLALVSEQALVASGAVVLFAFATVCMKIDPGALREDCWTLGGLAIKASALNYGQLTQRGGAVRANELWGAMAEVLSEFSDLPKPQMTRDTVLIAA